MRTEPIDDKNAAAFVDPADVVGRVATVDILQSQPVTPNLIEGVHAYELLVAE